MLERYVSTIAILLLLQSAVVAQETLSNQELSKTLEDIALHNQKNFESIHTLSGKADVEVRRYENDNLVVLQKTEIFFAVDKKRDWRVTRNTQYENWKMENGEKKISPCDISGYLLKDEEVYWYYAANPNVGNPDVDPMNHASVKGTIRLDKRDPLQHDVSSRISNFDPFRRIVPRISPAPSENMKSFAKFLATEPPPLPYSISQNGDLTTVIAEVTHGLSSVTNKYVFDVSKSCYLVEYWSSLNDIVGMDWKCEIEKIDGVWFPTLVTETISNGKSVTQLKFSDVKINQDIADDYFTLQFLGVKQQDHLYDTRTKTASEIDDPAFPLPEYLKALE